MSERVSRTILLCEDALHERLVKAYLRECDLPTQQPYLLSKVASRMAKGGNIGWVLQRFPPELHACRRRSKKARTLLICMADADEFPVSDRRQHFNTRLKEEGYEEFAVDDPLLALLIPRRHVETWIRSLLGEKMTEEEDCKSGLKLDKEQLRRAASTLREWARPGAKPGPTCVPSLEAALAAWRAIG